MGKRKQEEMENLENLAEEAVEVVEAKETESDGDNRVWELDGKVVSRSEFVRHQFLEGKKTKTEISKEFEIPYGAVYQATMNLDNGVESSGGRSKIYIDVDGEQVSRNDFIAKLVEEGMNNRKDILKALHEAGDETASYQTVYNATKDMEGFESQGRSGAKTIDVDGETITLKDFAVAKAKEGLSVSEIVKAAADLGVEVKYQVIYSYVGVKSRFTVKFDTMEELQAIYDEHKALFEEEAAAKKAEATEEAAE